MEEKTDGRKDAWKDEN